MFVCALAAQGPARQFAAKDSPLVILYETGLSTAAFYGFLPEI